MFNCWPPTERHNREKTSLFQWLKWISVGNKSSGEIPVLDLFFITAATPGQYNSITDLLHIAETG